MSDSGDKIIPIRPPAVHHSIDVSRDGNKISALIGPNLQEGLGGFGDTVPVALRDLADQMEAEGYRVEGLD